MLHFDSGKVFMAKQTLSWYSGLLQSGAEAICCWGCWLVDSVQGMLSTFFKNSHSWKYQNKNKLYLSKKTSLSRKYQIKSKHYMSRKTWDSCKCHNKIKHSISKANLYSWKYQQQKFWSQINDETKYPYDNVQLG